jgi:hypothetical protein
MSTSELVVPAIADKTTILGSPPDMMDTTFFIRRAEPTDVPPNFNTFMIVYCVFLLIIRH